MKILQIIQAKQYRGAEIFCCQFSNHLLDKGHDVMVISIYGGSAILPFKKPVYSLDRPKNNRYFDYAGWKHLSDHIKKFQPDIIQANAADTLKYAIFSKLVFKWKVPVIYRNASTSSFYIKSRSSKIFNAVLLKYVDLIISVSESSKKDLNILFPFTAPKTVVIPVGIERDMQISPLINIFDKTQFNIIHAGSFTREKNHLELIDIFKILLRSHSQCALHLIGDGDLRREVEDKIIIEGLTQKVFIHGGVKNPLSYIKAADVLVLPSIIEGLPGVVLEAMYCKTPVIAYDVGGISEIVLPGTGILIEEGDKESFAGAIQQILKEGSTIKTESAYNMVVDNFTNIKLSDKFLSRYIEIKEYEEVENSIS